MTSVASLHDVVKLYQRGSQRIEVLHHLNLEVPEGDFLGLMGPSGSGKTTLLNLLGGLDVPTSGEVSVAGERLERLGSSQLSRWRARHVGFVFQFYNLMPMLSAERNVELPLLLTSLSRTQRRRNVAAALELVGASAQARQRHTELSGGQQQRIAIARALIADPTLLLCDEPTGDLDRPSASQILDLLQLLNRQQHKTIIMVTHDQKAADYATRILHMDKGQLVDADARSAA